MMIKRMSWSGRSRVGCEGRRGGHRRAWGAEGVGGVVVYFGFSYEGTKEEHDLLLLIRSSICRLDLGTSSLIRSLESHRAPTPSDSIDAVIRLTDLRLRAPLSDRRSFARSYRSAKHICDRLFLSTPSSIRVALGVSASSSRPCHT